ncbi:hypothetical protein [Frateuria aurantia]|nr:hypothetical protein [Frateuria aurantia]
MDQHGASVAGFWLALYCAELLFAWCIFPSATLLLALDSHRLRIPGAALKTFSTLLWLALLCIVPASVAFYFAGISIWTSSLSIACAIMVGLTALWVPRWIFVIGCWTPSLIGRSVYLKDHMSLEHTSEMNTCLGVLLLALLAVCIGFARHYFRYGMPDSGLKAPMILQLRSSNYSWSGIGSKQNLALTWKWMQPRTDIRRGGPHRPVYSLRILLGGAFNPVHWNYYLKLIGFIAIYPALFMVFTSLLHSKDLSELGQAFFIGTIYGLFGSGITMIAIYNAVSPGLTVRRRWRQDSSELALMALLPGLGQSDTTSLNVLRTLTFSKPAWVLAAALLFDLVIACLHPLYLSSAGLIALILLTGYAAGIVGALYPITHCAELNKTHRWLASLGAILVFCLGYSTPIILMGTTDVADTRTWTYPLMLVDILAQLAAILILIIVACRCWQRLQAMPHPFLAR